mmetsp:Transcript_18414/g.31493  ORF Transcript_18414/g.31493 Transcript_18414/m.31493 type:complete len:115 (-) Transcript_18414:687-1031(-)
MDLVAARGISPDNCIYANPVKHVREIKVAKAHGIKRMTFDSIEEMIKIKEHFPEAELVIRLATDPSTAIYNLSEKYGAPMEEIDAILQKSIELGMKIVGVAFHTGSGGVTYDTY